MKTRNRLVSVLMFICVLLSACAAPAPTTAPAPTSVPSIPGEQVAISVGEGNETINATITGDGDVAIIFANTVGYDSSRWLPLIEALHSNEGLRMVTFVYRNEDATSAEDTRAVFDYLRTEGIDKVICVGAVYGSRACGYLQTEPEIAGMVLFTNAHVPVIETNFPKLFLAGSSDITGDLGAFQRTYEQSAEPKIFKSYDTDRNGPGLFTDPSVGPQVLADITDFVNGIVSGQ